MSTYSGDLVGRALHARDNRPAGRITAVYHYPVVMCAPAGAVAVSSGLLRRSRLVDLQDADVVDGVLTVPHDRDTIRRAPHAGLGGGGTLSEPDAAKVREHYRSAAQPV
ncbi:hypothetical protein [Phytohabitans rumicis]|uniref:PRC-barrel domain-containing protein n=1 Tax=Phytohabitans rumicis TaxID=1076125 RepID=A0A6V8LC26_9ACTN|nr:hypothetical protein [Phytohabitans rumicis]GFJ93190.1 hypothetical protein Prum_068320 [Phytohabitans rumicis]